MNADNSRVIPMTADHRIDADPKIRMGRIMPELPIDFAGPEPAFTGFESGVITASPNKTMADKYPKYHKSVRGLDSVDIYKVCELFAVEDASGALQHSIKKLLLSGVRTGGKSKFEDIKEARDTLTRWLEINAPGLA